MKYIRYTILHMLCVISSQAISQNKETSRLANKDKVNPYPLAKPKKTIIEGFYHGKADSVYYIINDYSQYSDWLTQMVENKPIGVPLESGHFKFETNLINPVCIDVRFIAHNMGGIFKGRAAKRHVLEGFLIEPGDSLFVHANKEYPPNWAPTYKDIFVSGRGAEKTIAGQAICHAMNMYDFPFDAKNGHKAYPRIGLNDSITKTILDILNIYKPTLSATAYSIIKAWYIPMFAVFPAEIIADNKWNVRDKAVQKIFKKWQHKIKSLIDLTDPALLYMPIYIERSLIYMPALLNEAIKRDEKYEPYMDFVREHYMALHEYIPEGPFKERVIALYLQRCFEKRGTSDALEACTRQFLEVNDENKSTYLAGLHKIFNIYTNNLAPGRKVFPFALPDTTGKIYHLDDFKGKVLLLDFMFTGCIGCAQMVPALKNVEEEFMNNPKVAFVSVSIDKPGQWRGSSEVEYYVHGSLFLHTDGQGSDHPLIKEFRVKGYPTLALIGKDGKIISARVKRPDLDKGAELRKMMNKALQ